MEHKKTMLDYIADCPEFIRNNVADSAALTEAKSKTYNAYDKTEFKTESEKIIFYKLCELYAFEKTLAAAEEEQKCLS